MASACFETLYPLQDAVLAAFTAAATPFGRLDSAANILANKLTALRDRQEPKDLADIWGFCTRLGLRLEDALEGASGKAAGLFPADIASALHSATEADWSLVRWIDAPPLQRYLSDLRGLGEKLLLL